ncbi:MAG: ROK family protein [Clostridiales bacterium]|nr:ROK family protein [Clostridiales bacterium]
MYYAGVDIGGKNTKMGIVDDFGVVVSSMEYKTQMERGYDAILLELIENIKSLCEQAGLDFDELSGIGIGVPGIVNSRAGLVMSCANLNWKGVELAGDVKNLTGKECKVCNDANCAALGEQRFGSGRNYKNLVFITLGTGIGSGIIIDGKLFEGLGCAGAEAGHMGIQIESDEVCSCGNKGCWESFISASALVAQTEEAAKKNPDSLLAKMCKEGVSGKTAFLAMNKGDAVAKNVVDRYISYITYGIIGLANILHPQAFVLGGGIANEGATLILPIKSALNAYIDNNGFYPYVDVVGARLGNSAGFMGAAALVM